MAKIKAWIITIKGDRPIHDIAKDLADAGLKGGRVLDEIGCIIGSAPEEAVAKMRKVRGVMDVSPDISVDVGPPGSRETW